MLEQLRGAVLECCRGSQDSQAGLLCISTPDDAPLTAAAWGGMLQVG